MARSQKEILKETTTFMWWLQRGFYFVFRKGQIYKNSIYVLPMKSVGILGATGAVGSEAIEALEGHPLFRVSHVFASERSAGRRLADRVTHAPAYAACVTLSASLQCLMIWTQYFQRCRMTSHID